MNFNKHALFYQLDSIKSATQSLGVINAADSVILLINFDKERNVPVCTNYIDFSKPVSKFLLPKAFFFLIWQRINHIYYETEYRTEWCQCNAKFVPCFLFARKFSRSAAMRILNDGLVGPFDAGSLFFPDS